ncbi:MAG TPA: hypothetical protein VKU19_31885 [Bryobacteraceae bacterium]|nr:hypothetical protein [Bryobacteraceae bacterium]
MRTLKVAFPAAVLMAGFMLCTTASYGKPEYMQKEKLKKCTDCHGKVEAKEAMAKNLNEMGKCYAANDHSLAKCKTPDKQ